MDRVRARVPKEVRTYRLESEDVAYRSKANCQTRESENWSASEAVNMKSRTGERQKQVVREGERAAVDLLRVALREYRTGNKAKVRVARPER